MKSAKTLLIVIIPLISGCLTYTKFIRTFDQNPSISKEETINKLNTKPTREIKLSPNVEVQLYNYFMDNRYLVVYFKDNKMVTYGPDNDYFHLESYYRVGLIDKDEYRWRYEMLTEERSLDRLARIQGFSALQDMQYQRKSLINQQRQINLQNQPKHTSGTIYDYKTGDTYNYQSTTR